MEFVYGKAPVYYIDGVPGYKAGEWPGLKSNKFENTRRIIQPKCCGIIFNEHEPLPPPRKKILQPGPSPEYVFRPCCKKVDLSNISRPPKINSIRVMEQIFTQNKLDYPKRHNFPYLVEKENKQKEIEKTTSLSTFVRNELKLATMVGFKNKDLEHISNRDLMGMRHRDYGGKIKLDFREDIEDPRQIRRQRQNDYNYVKNLNAWDDKNIKPKEIPKIVSDSSIQNMGSPEGTLANIETTTANPMSPIGANKK
ncbi:MAG: hypothetical protein MJ252_22970 [archaeon]|nr:hypothetical protein [archaeon]